MNKNTFGLFVGVLVAGLIFPVLSYAQVAPEPDSCVDLKNDLRYGSTDEETAEEVTALQYFLSRTDQNYLVGVDPITFGFFGPLTEKAVKRFQSAKNIVTSGTPETTGYGRVSIDTRTAIKNLTCINSITITTKKLSSGRVGKKYSQSVMVMGGEYPYTAKISEGALPSGLVLGGDPKCSGATCGQAGVKIAGTPTAPGVYSFTVTIADATTEASKAFTVTIGGVITTLPPVPCATETTWNNFLGKCAGPTTTTTTTTGTTGNTPRILSRDYIGTTDIPCTYGTTLIGPCMYEGRLMSIGYPPPNPDPSGYIEMGVGNVPFYQQTNRKALFLGGGKKYALKFKGDNTIIPGSFLVFFGGDTLKEIETPIELFAAISRTKGDFFDVAPGCLVTPASVGNPGAGGAPHSAASINVAWKGGPYDEPVYAKRGQLCILEPNGYYYLNVAGTCSAYWDPNNAYQGLQKDCPTAFSTGNGSWTGPLNP